MSGKGAVGAGASEEPKKGKSVVFAFGRFQPPHAGHGVLIRGVGEIAAKIGADAFVFATSTQNSKKNPLSVDEKIHYLQKMFHDAGVQFINTSVSGTPTIPQVLKSFQDAGYTHIIMATGSDHVDEYSKTWKKYGVNEVMGIGEARKDKSPGNYSLCGLSATKMREAALNGNRNCFAIGTHIGAMENKNVNELMATVAGRLKGGRRRITLRKRARRSTRKVRSKN